MATHPSFDCTEDVSPDWAEGSWARPALSDHPEAEDGADFDELSESDQDAIRGRFIEQSGDDYGSLRYPVKNPQTDCLNRNGVLAARQRASAEDDSEVASVADDLWEDNFEDEEGEEMVTFTVSNRRWIMHKDTREISLNDRLRAIRGQFYTEFDDIENGVEYFVKEVFEDSLIAYADHEDALYRIGYEWSDEGGRIDVTFEDEGEWVVVEQEYVPADDERQALTQSKAETKRKDGKSAEEITEEIEAGKDGLLEAGGRSGPHIKKSPSASMARHCRDEGLAYYRDFAPWDTPNPKVTRSSTEDRVDVTINSRTPDRHGTIILPRGGRLERYNEGNPIVLINHDHNLPAGVSTVSVREPNGSDPVLQATMADREWDLDDERIRRWHGKVTSDPPIVRSSSIGALFHEVVPGRDFDGIDQMMDTSSLDPRELPDVVTDWTLAEWSWVSVPSNPDATISRQIIDRMAREAQSQIDRVTNRAEQAIQKSSVPSNTERSSDEDGPSTASPDQDGGEKDGTPTRLSNEEVQFLAKKTAEDEIDRATGRK